METSLSTNPQPDPDKVKVDLKGLVRLRGCTERAVYYWIDEGCPHTKYGRGMFFFNPEAVEAWLQARNRDGTPGSKSLIAGPGVAADVRDELARAKLRKEQALASRHEHNLAVAKGDYMLAEQVQQERLERILSVKAQLLALPGKLAMRLAHRSSEDIYNELRTEVHNLLLDFAGGQLPKEAVA